MILVKGASEKRVVAKRLCYPPQEQLINVYNSKLFVTFLVHVFPVFYRLEIQSVMLVFSTQLCELLPL
jgi:hypothetical protein